MPRLLHILTKPDDSFARDVIARQEPNFETEVVDLTVREPDYDQLLEAVFKADSVQVW